MKSWLVRSFEWLGRIPSPRVQAIEFDETRHSCLVSLKNHDPVVFDIDPRYDDYLVNPIAVEVIKDDGTRTASTASLIGARLIQVRLVKDLYLLHGGDNYTKDVRWVLTTERGQVVLTAHYEHLPSDQVRIATLTVFNKTLERTLTVRQVYRDVRHTRS